LSRVEELQGEFIAQGPIEHGLALAIEGCRIRVHTDSPEVEARLREYFRDWVVDGNGPAVIDVYALERPTTPVDTEWRDWPRDPGKRGIKERVSDYGDGRLISKVRTGMLFLLHYSRVVALGPCVENLNQVVNLVNNQYITWCMHQGWELCHAAGVRLGEGGLALAGVSGAGKSTLALRLLDEGASFISNDRLLVRKNGAVWMTGVPKHPRVNPGTLLDHDELRLLVPPERAEELSSLPTSELWEIEEKYDVNVADVFGPGRFMGTCEMSAFVLLAWSRHDDAPPHFEVTNLWREPGLLDAIKKHPGPFFHDGCRYDSRGSTHEVEPGPYLRALGEVPLLLVTGGVDFSVAVEECLRLLKR